jgi:hypothetical protein
MAQGKRGRPMTAVDVKLAKLLSDVAYIQAQVDKDESVTSDQRTQLNVALVNVGVAIHQAQQVFPAQTVSETVVDTSETDTANVEQLNAVVENAPPVLVADTQVAAAA